MTYKGFGNKDENINYNTISKKTLKKWYVGASNGDIDCAMKVENYYKNLWNEYSKQEGSTMIHEKDYVPMTCCLCGKNMDYIHNTHNPYPLTPKCFAKEAQENNLPHRCCDECEEEMVLPARELLYQAKGRKKMYVLATKADQLLDMYKKGHKTVDINLV